MALSDKFYVVLDDTHPTHIYLFVCVEFLWPNQPNEVMSSAVSLLGRLSPLSGL